MGKYFYSSPLISYTSTIGGITTNKQETTLNNASGYSNGLITNGNLNFTSTITSNSLVNVTSTTLNISALVYNVYNISGTNATSKTINVITDGPSCTLVYTTLAQSMPTLSTSASNNGYRIYSAPTISNNCPNLNLSGTEYFNIPYLNSWDITKTNNAGGIDATTELMVYNGSFIAFSSTAYQNYSSSLNNTGIDYSTISTAAGSYRFATFCWKFPNTTSSFTGLSFTLNSTSTFYNQGTKIQMNVSGGRRIDPLIFYAIRDTENDYSENSLNTVWINANSNTNMAGAATYFDTTNNTYGSLGGFLAVTSPANASTGTTGTINVFIPGRPPSNSTYLYLRIGLPMNENVNFTSVKTDIK